MSRQTVAISGASGLVGTHLQKRLMERGDKVLTLTRSKSKVSSDRIYWNLQDQVIDSDALRGVDTIIHLAGESVAQRWSDAAKERILESRRLGTRLLAKHICSLPQQERPLFISASAIGYYGDRGSELVDESSPSGTGFLAEVCRVWEQETEPVIKGGSRVALLRIGIVLSSEGGALAKMVLPFKMGVGGKLGSGRQYFSWITLSDLVRVMLFIINNKEVSGPVNGVTASVTNAELTKALGRAVKRPTLFSVPSFAMKLTMGEMASEMLLEGQRVDPRVLRDLGFVWTDTDLDKVLKALT